jgi:hypothetical protein
LISASMTSLCRIEGLLPPVVESIELQAARSVNITYLLE